MNLYFIELGPHRDDIGLLTGGSLLVTASDAQHAEGVADEYILERNLRAKIKIRAVRQVPGVVAIANAHEALVIDHAYVYE